MPTTPANPAQALAAIAAMWLSRARTYDDIVQSGTVAAGQAGGGGSTVNWNRTVPEAPAYADELVLQFSLPITLTVPASGSATFSPLAPWCAFQRQLNLGGSNAIPYVSGVPFWLDALTSRRNLDPVDAGSTPVKDPGPDAYSLDGLTPGEVVSNASTTTAATTNYTLVWRERIQLGRNLYGRISPNLYGCIPLGDPDHRPELNMYLGNLVGTHPEDSLFVNATSGTTCVVGTGGATVQAVWDAKSLDILPPGFPALPTPRVLMGLAVESNGSQSIQNAGQIQQIPHRTAQLDQKIFHLLVNGELPIEADYFGLWLTGEQQSARWQYDATLNNFFMYYEKVHKHYGQYLPEGMYVADFIGGDFPEMPRETPYEAIMTPDTAYAAQAIVPPTPSMYTAIRVPSGTSMSGAYVRTYTFGLVNVSY